MIYALVAIILIEQFLLGYVITEARKERQDLEDRLMAIAQPVALVSHKAASAEPGDVTYVDERREWELSPSGGGLDGS